MGTPGRYSKLEVARKKSLPTRVIEGSGLKPGKTGLARAISCSVSISRSNARATVLGFRQICLVDLQGHFCHFCNSADFFAPDTRASSSACGLIPGGWLRFDYCPQGARIFSSSPLRVWEISRKWGFFKNYFPFSLSMGNLGLQQYPKSDYPYSFTIGSRTLSWITVPLSITAVHL